jgi:hypothetical protein
LPEYEQRHDRQQSNQSPIHRSIYNNYTFFYYLS